ncbi:hypothetical protein [Silvibacterium acidisoli]|uniref:hypothetical protein n=1 Tax=Acidobacteriaceae bacterium ZG23-2 TaxID=2883246 RepID=UPI00406D26F1
MNTDKSILTKVVVSAPLQSPSPGSTFYAEAEMALKALQETYERRCKKIAEQGKNKGTF